MHLCAAHQPCHCEIHKVLGDYIISEGNREYKKVLNNKECSSVFKKILTAYLGFENP